MYNSIIILILFFMIIYCYNCEGIQFYDPGMKYFYKKHNIIYDKKRKLLIKNNKTADISNGLNGKKTYTDKNSMKKIFLDNGIPTSKWYVWDTNLPNTINLKMLKSHNLKFPLVIKPYDTYGGVGVITDIDDFSKLMNLIPTISKTTDAIIIEEQVIGDTYRIFVFNNIILDIYKIRKPKIVGDGKSSVTKLLKNYINEQEVKLIKSQIDYDLIKKQGYNINSIIPKNKKVIITNLCNASIGSEPLTVNKNNIHPANIEFFKKVARTVNLNACGIDYITKDLKIPYYIYGSVIETNSKPGIQLYIKNNPDVIHELLNNIKFT